MHRNTCAIDNTVHAQALTLSLINGFAPGLGDEFGVLTYDSLKGSFDTVEGTDLGDGLAFLLAYNLTDLTLTVGSAAPGRLGRPGNEAIDRPAFGPPSAEIVAGPGTTSALMQEPAHRTDSLPERRPARARHLPADVERWVPVRGRGGSRQAPLLRPYAARADLEIAIRDLLFAEG